MANNQAFREEYMLHDHRQSVEIQTTNAFNGNVDNNRMNTEGRISKDFFWKVMKEVNHRKQYASNNFDTEFDIEGIKKLLRYIKWIKIKQNKMEIKRTKAKENQEESLKVIQRLQKKVDAQEQHQMRKITNERKERQKDTEKARDKATENNDLVGQDIDHDMNLISTVNHIPNKDMTTISKPDVCDHNINSSSPSTKQIQIPSQKPQQKRKSKAETKQKKLNCDNSNIVKPFQCSECGNQYKIKSSLKTHFKVHTSEAKICKECGKRFPNQFRLKVHMRSHTGERPYGCNICGKAFAAKANLTAHKRIHTDKRPYKCDICSKQFVRKSSLTIHKRIHTGKKPYKCDICLKELTSKPGLIRHKRIHTGERPYKCDICPKAFCQITNLIRHKRYHTGEKPYKCQFCSKAFADSSSLSIHLTVHSDIRPFECAQCKKRFKTKRYLRAHIKRH